MTGISIFVASGDAGAATNQNLDCKDTVQPIQPEYPAACPWVTTVGGTMFSSASVLPSPLPYFCQKERVTCAGSGVEVVSQVPEALITGGGGFSDVAPTPAWQAAQVKTYLSTSPLIPPSSDFNAAGRAYPDITALAHHYMIVEKGFSSAVDG